GATGGRERRISSRGGSSHLAVGPAGELAVRIVPKAASGNKLYEGVDSIAVSMDDGASWRTGAAPGERDWPSSARPGGTTPRWVEPLAWDASGALYSFWTAPRGLWLARSKDRGATWTSWKLDEPADTSFYPYLVARGRGELAATWFSGSGDAWRAHVARIDVGARAPTRFEQTMIVPDTWGLSSRRESPERRNSAGEYLAIAFLRDGSLAVVSP